MLSKNVVVCGSFLDVIVVVTMVKIVFEAASLKQRRRRWW
jgi:hypothetical protein